MCEHAFANVVDPHLPVLRTKTFMIGEASVCSQGSDLLMHVAQKDPCCLFSPIQKLMVHLSKYRSYEHTWDPVQLPEDKVPLGGIRSRNLRVVVTSLNLIGTRTKVREQQGAEFSLK
jgi:hypothetical protein